MPANLTDENGYAPPISKSRFNPATAQAISGATKCYLFNKRTSEWLHWSGEIMTGIKDHRWTGTEKQARTIKGRFGIARGLTIIITA